jgi:hypothetical protein
MTPSSTKAFIPVAVKQKVGAALRALVPKSAAAVSASPGTPSTPFTPATPFSPLALIKKQDDLTPLQRQALITRTKWADRIKLVGGVALDAGHAKVTDPDAYEIGVLLTDPKATGSLTSLELRANNISATGAEGLGKGLKKNKNLLYLSLYNNSIVDAGANGLAEGLKVQCMCAFFYREERFAPTSTRS